MKRLIAPAIALMMLAAPAFAGGVIFDFPRLTYPTDSAAEATRGCNEITMPGAGCKAEIAQ